MKFSVQIEEFKLIKEAVSSNCDCVRFGSEFCEYKIPRLETVDKAYEAVRRGDKEFKYVTPRLSNSGVEKVRKHLDLLNEKGITSLVVNDLGTLNMLKNYKNIRPHLGRQLIRVPARSPWTNRYIKDGGFRAKKWFNRAFTSTSLNFSLSVDFFKSLNVRNVDLDWIPRIFPSFDFLAKQGLDLSVHLHLVPVTLTRRCHTARFLGEKRPEACSKPCVTEAFHLRNGLYDLEFFLLGNVVFHFEQPSKEDFEKLNKDSVSDLVLTMNPISGIDSRKKVNDFILNFR